MVLLSSVGTPSGTALHVAVEEGIPFSALAPLAHVSADGVAADGHSAKRPCVKEEWQWWQRSVGGEVSADGVALAVRQDEPCGG